MLETSASELALAYLNNGSTPSLLLAWAEGGSLYNAYFDPTTGALLRPIEALTTSSRGRYSQLTILAATSGGAASILTRYRDGDQIELREIEVDPDGSEGLNDSDGDGLNDLVELRIVDADPLDGLNTLADVNGSDDFDEDGENNATEIANGPDTIVSSIVFELPDKDLGIVTLLYEQSGQLTLTISTFPGNTYVLQSGPDVTNWTDKETKEAKDVLLSFTIEGPPAGEPFYRIERR